MKDYSNFTHQDKPICPWCSAIYELEGGFDAYNDFSLTCVECNKLFHVEPYTTTDFTTHGDCLAYLDKHQFYRPDDEFSARYVPYTCQKCGLAVYDWALQGGQHQKFTSDQYEILKQPTGVEK